MDERASPTTHRGWFRYSVALMLAATLCFAVGVALLRRIALDDALLLLWLAGSLFAAGVGLLANGLRSAVLAAVLWLGLLYFCFVVWAIASSLYRGEPIFS